ncbi:zinc-binding dehydrogenase [Dankookia sp. P2]|uniref:zinc-binding dehydrogenase n=1 Tax=Dankookia sp. P2 TaxID=3423955 RepID=UPI003D673AAB
MNIFRRSEIKAGQTVAIVGIGFLGAILTRLATDAGARVIAISRRPFSLDLARQMGAAETIPMDDHHAIIGQVKALTGGSLCDRVIEAVGKQWPLDLAARAGHGNAAVSLSPATTRTDRGRSTCGFGIGAAWT